MTFTIYESQRMQHADHVSERFTGGPALLEPMRNLNQLYGGTMLRRKSNLARSKTVVSDRGERWNGSAEAARALNCEPATIRNACRGILRGVAGRKLWYEETR